MAHDVGFYDNKTNENIGYFFGFAEAAWYKLLDAEHCYAGVSGNGKTVVKSSSEMIAVLNLMEKLSVVINYPDQNRFPKIFKTIRNWIIENPSREIKIKFS
jgi:hypothetical protein